jgi:hypothetical protein
LHLDAGDEVDIIENAGSLTINGKQHNGFKTTTIDITGLSIPMVWRFFQSAYREGYDEIKLVYDKSKKDYESAYNYYASQFSYTRMGEKPQKRTPIDMITELVNRFIGIAIIDNGENYCTIREMGEITSKEFDNSLRRIFLLIMELFDKLIHLLKSNQTGDISICKTLHTMDINIDRFIDYCCRINNKINDSTFQKNKPLIFSTLFLLELLGDEFKYIGNHLSPSKIKVEEVVDFAESVKKHFETYYHVFYKFDRNEVIKFGENDYKIYNEHFAEKEHKNRDVNSIYRHLMQISKFTFCLMEIRIEMEY